jgi:hypothetical protein
MEASRSTTPTPRNPDGSRPQFRSGILAIRIERAEGLELPSGVQTPPAVQAALGTAASPSRAIKLGGRESVRRIGCWWLPYLVVEYEVNQIVLTPVSGNIEQPVYMYQVTLCVPVSTYLTLLRSKANVCVIFLATCLETRKYLSNVISAPTNPDVTVTVSRVTMSTWVESDSHPISMIWMRHKHSGTSCLVEVGKEGL